MQSPRPATESRAVSGERRLFRPTFSLRTLLLGMAVLGAGLGLFQRLDRQRQLVARIEAAGGICGYQTRDSSGRFETWFRAMLPQSYFDDVWYIGFDENNNNVDGILAHVAELQSLDSLNLANTKVSDEGLAHLARLKSLRWVDLHNTQVSDPGLAHLARLKSLKVLYLTNTQVSDAGLADLAELRSLERLYLEKTQASDAGVQRLKSFLSKCRIYCR